MEPVHMIHSDKYCQIFLQKSCADSLYYQLGDGIALPPKSLPILDIID